MRDDPRLPRPWFHFSLATYLMVLVYAATLLGLNTVPRRTVHRSFDHMGRANPRRIEIRHGWPFCAYFRRLKQISDQEGGTTEPHEARSAREQSASDYEVRVSAWNRDNTIYNAAIAVLICVVLGIAFEKALRVARRRKG